MPCKAAAAWVLALACGLVGPVWAAGPGAAASLPAAVGASRPGWPPAIHAGTPVQRLAALEQLARAQPQQVLAALDGLLPQLPQADPQRLLALALRGTLQAGLDDAQGVDLTVRELEALQARWPVAAAAAGLVRAEQASRHGPARRAERLATEALGRLPPDAPVSLRLRLLRVLARAKEDIGALDDALRLRQQAVVLADQQGQPWQRAEAYNWLADVLQLAQQGSKAAEINRQAMALAQEAGDPIAESSTLTTLSFLQADAGDMPGVLRSMTRVIELTRAAGARRSEVLARANLADYYLRAGEFATALQVAQEALPLAREIHDPTSESVALANIGLALISLHQRDQGLSYVRQSMAIDERNGALTALAAVQEELGRYLERAGYLQDALQAYRRHRQLADEVFRRDQQQAVLELQEGFDSERRQRELALLQLDNQLKQAEILGSELQRQAWLAGIALGVLALALVGVLLMRLRLTGMALSEGNAQLRLQSERDPLTELANRRYVQRLMQGGGPAGAAGFEGALLLIDLDHFKQINDRHGHAAGDAVLVEVARRLRTALRDDDLVVRWGGEEFLVLAAAPTPDQVQALAQRLLGAVGGRPVDLPVGGGAPVAVTASIGYACFPIEPIRLAVGWEQALDLVDTALYLAKAHGRNLAYGVRELHARDDTELQQISRSLEAAWTEGRVQLMPSRGPEVPA